MKVYYHSVLNETELTPGGVLRTVPCKAVLKLHREKTESPCELVYNGTIINPDTTEIECNEEAELVIRQDGERYTYLVRPSVQVLTTKNARAYEQFSYEYRNMEFDEISSIQLGTLKLYAVDQSTEVRDFSEVFGQINNAFNAFKAICEKPKSHLKAVNEVRPIETVKRIGYESIPYLAAHSEDWLARTASGLKPARLFSRVEDDEYQIYENRVVKTLIDLILSFLRKTEKQLRDQREQLYFIMSSSVQTGSFGFDVSFQKAVSELMSSDDKGDEYLSKNLELAEKFQKQAYALLKRYRTLRQTKLYRYLKKTKPVLNPLNETNILAMDKYYSVIYKLWRIIHHVIAPKVIEDENFIAFDDICDDYQQFCATLCGYSAHVIGFELIENGHYQRSADNIDLQIVCTDDGLIEATVKDIKPRSIVVPTGIDVPIQAGTSSYRVSYDGNSLTWPNDISADEMDSFCGLFKTRESRGKEQSEEKRKYTALKSLLDQAQRSYPAPLTSSFIIIPTAVELGAENRTAYKSAMEQSAHRYLADNPENQIIIALPVCNESEQKITEYAKESGQIISLLPLTMFDINSFRRLQNILYQQILRLKKDTCPNCGGVMRKNDNRLVCDNCNQLMLTKTKCSNPECRHEYVYMGYEVPAATLQKMQAVSQESFFEWDSLYQYKNVVNMSVDTGKLRTICPYCHKV